MEFCRLPADKLRPNPDNPFPPLEKDEYEDLKESIRTHGIQVPLIVTENAESAGCYLIYSGHNRWNIAKDLQMDLVPCIVTSPGLVEAAIDTEIFRRFLTPEQRREAKRVKQEKTRVILEKYWQSRLLPELFDKYRQGIVETPVMSALADLNREAQMELLESLHKISGGLLDGADGSAAQRSQGKAGDERNELEELKHALAGKEAVIQEMKDREIKARELLKQKLSELEDAKENAGEALRQECEKETAELLEKVRDLSLLIKEKNDEIDKMREEKKKAERMYEGRQAEVNAVVLKMKEYKETCRSFVVQLCRPEVLVSRLNTVEAELDTISDHISHLTFTWDPETEEFVKGKTEDIIAKAKKITAAIGKKNGSPDVPPALKLLS